MKRRKIETMEELKQLGVKGCDCFIRLNHGLISRKTVYYDPQDEEFEVYNHIDDTEQKLSEEEINDKEYTNIGKALTMGALYIDD